jgi:glycosyltransferase involved in cell wall biosynthesis
MDMLLATPIDYHRLYDENTFFIRDLDILYDISVIIPIRGRHNFMRKTLQSLQNAMANTDLKIAITISEHSGLWELEDYFETDPVNYIHLNANGAFNKCLANNIAFLYSVRARYYLFQDVDFQVRSDFFLSLEENLLKKDARAMQCFPRKTYISLLPEITNDILNDNISINDLKFDLPTVNGGATGGSILVKRELFLEVGGYDPELFWSYAPEDIFFWEKISTLDYFHECDDPPIKQYHLWHPHNHNRNVDLPRMQELVQLFKNMDHDSKKQFLQYKSSILQQA